MTSARHAIGSGFCAAQRVRPQPRKRADPTDAEPRAKGDIPVIEFPLTATQTALALGLAFFGGTLQGMVGFGSALVATPFLVLVSPVFVPAPMILAVLALTLLVALRERGHVDLDGLKWAILGRVPGSIAAGAVLLILQQESLMIFLGAVVLLAVALSAAGLHIAPVPRNLFCAGLLSGFMGTSTSVGGPPMALVYQREHAPRFRSTLAVYFIVGATVSLLVLGVGGKFAARELLVAIPLVLGVVAGFFASSSLRGVVDAGLLRPAILAMSALGGATVILRALF